jgi:hypothetical protein
MSAVVDHRVWHRAHPGLRELNSNGLWGNQDRSIAYTGSEIMKLRLFVLILVTLSMLFGAAWWTLDRFVIQPSRNAGGSNGQTNPQPMTMLEQWTRGQLLKITNDLITPKLAFTTLKLELPATCTLTDVTLTSGDLAIIEMASMKLVFRELPQKGQPLVIESASFIEPKIRLIGQPEGGLKGYSDFIKSTQGRAYDDGGSTKPSDVFAIRHIAIDKGMLEWSQVGHEHPLILQELTMKLSTSPDTEKPGWYGFNAVIKREPVITLNWDGGISIDTGDLDFNDATLIVDLEADEYSALTPQIQDFLSRHQIVGDLMLHVTGRVPLTHAHDTDLAFEATLLKANAVLKEYQFPIEQADLKATFRNMRFSFDPVHVNAFQGTIDSTGYFDFNDTDPFQFEVKADDVMIQDMLRTTSTEDPKFKGKLELTLNARGESELPVPTLQGNGELNITEGNLMNLSVVDAIGDALRLSDSKRRDALDTAMAKFTIKNDRISIDQAQIESSLAAARGTGDVYYTNRIDLLVNAGTLEKMTGLLGPVGDVLGKLTDRLLPFRVTGTLQEPVVKAQPLSLPIGNSRNAGK